MRKFTGAAVCALALSAGGWLMTAPFALGTQPEGAGWVDATKVEFITGLGVIGAGLLGLSGFSAAIRADLVTRGVVRRRPRRTREKSPAPRPYPPAAQPDELTSLLARLTQAMEQDARRTRAIAGPAREEDR